MSTDITLPALGESVTEGTVTRWLKAVGDTVAVDEPLVEISTDKVDTEIPSPVAGVLLEILIPEDETAVVGAVLARIGAAGDAPAAPASAPEVVATPVEAAPVEAAPVAATPVAPAPVAPATVAAAPVAAAPVALPPVSPVVEAPVVAVETAPVAAPAAVVAAAPAAVEPTAAPAPSGGRDIVLPALGESVTEGTVTRWLKAVGDAVTVDEPLLEISTDKVDTEIPSPFAGVLTEILVREDDTATVGAVLGRISAAGVAPTSAPPLAPAPLSFEPAVTPAPIAPVVAAPVVEAPSPVAAPVAPAPAPLADAPMPVAEAPAPPVEAPAPVATTVAEAPAPVAPTTTPAAPALATSDAGRYVTPIVRKLAADSGVDISAIAGSGVGGRIRKEDVLAAAAPVAPAAPTAPAPVATPSATATAPATASTAPTAASAPGTVSPLRGTTVKMTRLRSIIAQRMVESMRQQAQLTTVVEVDVTRVATLRSKAKDSFQARENAKLTFLPFFTKAAAEALREHPALNASIDGENIVYHPTENIAIAVDTEKGLVAPIIKGAGEASLADHARAIGDLAARARTNQLTLEDLTGATFTVTNTGSGGALFDTPIVVSPQVAIMGTGAIARRAVVVTDDRGEEVIAIRSMCYLSISYDHRLVDGADAARFLATVKARIEEGTFETELGL